MRAASRPNRSNSSAALLPIMLLAAYLLLAAARDAAAAQSSGAQQPGTARGPHGGASPAGSSPEAAAAVTWTTAASSATAHAWVGGSHALQQQQVQHQKHGGPPATPVTAFRSISSDNHHHELRQPTINDYHQSHRRASPAGSSSPAGPAAEGGVTSSQPLDSYAAVSSIHQADRGGSRMMSREPLPHHPSRLLLGKKSGPKGTVSKTMKPSSWRKKNNSLKKGPKCSSSSSSGCLKSLVVFGDSISDSGEDIK